MTRLTGPQSLMNTISLLGGPLPGSTDIDWVANLPAGKAFFEWLADQLHGWSQKLELQNITSGNAVDDEKNTSKIRMYAALREVALERDEVLILNHDSSLRSIASDVPNVDYMPLSRLERQASYINNETELLKRETDLLSSRLALSKKVSQKPTQAIKSLQQALNEVESDTRNAEEGLSELSVNTDMTIATTLSNAKALIHNFIISDPDDNVSMKTRAVEKSENVSNHVHISDQRARSSLALAQTSLTAIVTDLQEYIGRSSFIRKEEASTNEDIVRMEANRLKAVLNSINLKSSSTNYILTMDPELEDTCALLEREADSRERGAAPTDLIQDFLQGLDAQDDNPIFLNPAVDVDAEISHAWCLDQIAMFQTHESGLDQASNSLDCVLAPLDQLHTSLARVWYYVQEAEALLEAFGDELEDIDMDFVNKKLAAKNDVHNLQNHLNPSSVALFPEDAEPLTRRKYLAAMESSEKAWIEALIHEYLLRPIHPSLPHIYANSPLTTCVPFAFPTQVQEIKAHARDRAMRLESLVKKLEVQVHEMFINNDLAEQLDTFVEQWCQCV